MALELKVHSLCALSVDGIQLVQLGAMHQTVDGLGQQDRILSYLPQFLSGETDDTDSNFKAFPHFATTSFSSAAFGCYYDQL